jgi:cardiolipin synthase A/B
VTAERTSAERAPDTAWYFVPRAVYTGGNEVMLLRGGDRLFPAMREAIARAIHEVWVATYIFHDDESALAIVDVLVAAAQRGVRVRAVIDGFGSNHTLAHVEERLRSGGVVVVVFRPLHGWWSWLQPGQLRRLHQKLCVVDGDVAFVGGINIIDDCLDLNHGRTDTPRLDFAVRLRGPVVVPVEQTARAVWTRAMIGRDWRDEIVSIVRNPQPLANVRRLLAAVRMRPRATLPGAQLSPVRAAFVVRDNLRQRRSIERSYVEAINRARERIDLISPYFYPGTTFMRALLRAARRGVRVRLVMQGRWDYRFAAMAAHAVYEQLLRRGVRIYEYTPAFLHAKVAVIDDEWATVGSSNIDPLSLLVNLEANVVVQDAEFTASLAAEIEAAIAASREVTLADFSQRASLLGRVFVAWVARLYVRLSGGSGQY